MKKTIMLVFLIFVSVPVSAGTYGRISGGQALDVIAGVNLTSALSGRFVEGYNPQPYWTQVPDLDTGGKLLVSGARDNGNKTFTNPAPPLVVMVDAQLDKAAFAALLAANGNDLAAALKVWPQVGR